MKPSSEKASDNASEKPSLLSKLMARHNELWVFDDVTFNEVSSTSKDQLQLSQDSKSLPDSQKVLPEHMPQQQQQQRQQQEINHQLPKVLSPTEQQQSMQQGNEKSLQTKQRLAQHHSEKVSQAKRPLEEQQPDIIPQAQTDQKQLSLSTQQKRDDRILSTENTVSTTLSKTLAKESSQDKEQTAETSQAPVYERLKGSHLSIKLKHKSDTLNPSPTNNQKESSKKTTTPLTGIPIGIPPRNPLDKAENTQQTTASSDNRKNISSSSSSKSSTSRHSSAGTNDNNKSSTLDCVPGFENRIYIGNLHLECSRSAVFERFKRYGYIEYILRNVNTTHAFIDYSNDFCVAEAIKDANGKLFKGGKLRVEPYRRTNSSSFLGKNEDLPTDTPSVFSRLQPLPGLSTRTENQNHDHATKGQQYPVSNSVSAIPSTASSILTSNSIPTEAPPSSSPSSITPSDLKQATSSSSSITSSNSKQVSSSSSKVSSSAPASAESSSSSSSYLAKQQHTDNESHRTRSSSSRRSHSPSTRYSSESPSRKRQHTESDSSYKNTDSSRKRHTEDDTRKRDRDYDNRRKYYNDDTEYYSDGRRRYDRHIPSYSHLAKSSSDHRADRHYRQPSSSSSTSQDVSSRQYDSDRGQFILTVSKEYDDSSDKRQSNRDRHSSSIDSRQYRNDTHSSSSERRQSSKDRHSSSSSERQRSSNDKHSSSLDKGQSSYDRHSSSSSSERQRSSNDKHPSSLDKGQSSYDRHSSSSSERQQSSSDKHSSSLNKGQSSKDRHSSSLDRQTSSTKTQQSNKDKYSSSSEKQQYSQEKDPSLSEKQQSSKESHSSSEKRQSSNETLSSADHQSNNEKSSSINLVRHSQEDESSMDRQCANQQRPTDPRKQPPTDPRKQLSTDTKKQLTTDTTKQLPTDSREQPKTDSSRKQSPTDPRNQLATDPRKQPLPTSHSSNTSSLKRPADDDGSSVEYGNDMKRQSTIKAVETDKTGMDISDPKIDTSNVSTTGTTMIKKRTTNEDPRLGKKDDFSRTQQQTFQQKTNITNELNMNQIENHNIATVDDPSPTLQRLHNVETAICQPQTQDLVNGQLLQQQMVFSTHAQGHPLAFHAYQPPSRELAAIHLIYTGSLSHQYLVFRLEEEIAQQISGVKLRTILLPNSPFTREEILKQVLTTGIKAVVLLGTEFERNDKVFLQVYEEQPGGTNSLHFDGSEQLFNRILYGKKR
ncbi:uncharacterized protein BX664DRAFT_326366 [Halteromyces radiatus]|uniref:uncharacterized protein n=1 Tax=Halteromyces radiatus TaxID=101107 RepID=UPI002220F728|nr:uncharacterized protein BX664DRAFT_326366 [Halteromyces radiatus]KAI8097438.1 hypothetical protein BX664DRAFT_326366 [Halteromyces radiatus]